MPPLGDLIIYAFLMSIIGVFIRYHYFRKEMKAKHHKPKSIFKFYATRIFIRRYIKQNFSKYGNEHTLKRVRERALDKSELATNDNGLMIIRDSLKELMKPSWGEITPDPKWKFMYDRVLSDLSNINSPTP